MQPIKILAHSYAFPPMAFPRSIQVPRLLKSLNAQIAVICGDDPYARQDETIHPDITENFTQIIRVAYRRNEWLHRLDRHAGRFGFSWLRFPDHWRPWNLQVSKNVLNGQIKLPFEPDLLMTFGQPMSDHLFGLAYKQQTNKPWIAHFSDPWTDNPFRRDNRLAAWYNRRLEQNVLEKADAVIFTSPETIDLVMQKYPTNWRKKVFYIPHCYDERLYPQGQEASRDKTLTASSERYTLRSVGNFYGSRSPKPLFDAVEQIANDKPNLLHNVSFELVGSIVDFDPTPYSVAQQFIKCIGTVSYAKSIQLMQTSHCLLVIDAPAEISVFFPSKLVDYIGAKRFILALSPPGTTSRTVNEIGGLVANPSNYEAVVRVLTQVLQQRPNKLSVSTEHYTPEGVGKQMSKVLEIACSA